MSVLTSNSLNLMSGPVLRTNEETAGILKDKNSKKSTSGENQVPARIKGTRSFSPCFTRAVYDRFIRCLKEGEEAWPFSKDLRKMGFPVTSGVTPRRKFRVCLPRLELATVDGPLVFSAHAKQEVLVSKRSKKIIVPVEAAEKIVRRAHLFGTNRPNAHEKRRRHGSVANTISVLEKDFAVKHREFGINRPFVKQIVNQCSTCSFAVLSDDGTEPEMSPKPPTMLSKSEEVSCSSTCEGKSVALLMPNHVPCQLNGPRFSSMVAHCPDKKCIWYDRESIAGSSNRFNKLLLVMREMKGDMALTVRGNPEAKQRFETKLYCARLLIKDYTKALQQSLMADDPQVVTCHLEELKQEYLKAGQASIFTSDLQELLISCKNYKITLPPMLVEKIESTLIEQVYLNNS